MSEIIIAAPKTGCPKLDTHIQRWMEGNDIPTIVTDPKLKAEIDQWGISWFRAGAVVVNNKGEILMTHEGRVQVKKIKDAAIKEKYLSEGLEPGDWVDGDGGWNLPSGRLSLGENNLKETAQRETKDETGWDVEIGQHLCTRSSEKANNRYIMPVYLAEAIDGPAEYHTTETRETLEIRWMTPTQIRQLHADNQLRSPEFVIEALKAYEKTIT